MFMEESDSGQFHTLGKREPFGFVGSNPTSSAIYETLERILYRFGVFKFVNVFRFYFY